MHYSTFALALTTLFSYHVLATPQAVPPQLRTACSKWPEFVDKTTTLTRMPAVTNTVTVTVPSTYWTTSTELDVFLVQTEFSSTTTKIGGTTTIYNFPDSTPAPRLVRAKRSGSAKAAPALQERGSPFLAITRYLCSSYVTPTTVTSIITPTVFSTRTNTATIIRTTWQAGQTTVSTTTILATVVIPAATATVAACGSLDHIDNNQSYGVTYSTTDDAYASSGLECCKRCYLAKGCDMWLFGGTSCRVYTNGNFGEGRSTDSANCPFGKVNAGFSVASSGQGSLVGAGPCGDH